MVTLFDPAAFLDAAMRACVTAPQLGFKSSSAVAILFHIWNALEPTSALALASMSASGRSASMGHFSPFKPIALVVEDDATQRAAAVMVLEENGMGVIECGCAEDALRVLDKMGGCFSLIFTDVNLGGEIDGVELAEFAHHCYPDLRVVITSGLALPRAAPEGTIFMPKPWTPLDLLREAEQSRH
jgi:CheY-like chemotaxis protein